MAAAHLLAASASSSSTAAFHPPLRLRSPAHTPHLRLNRTGISPLSFSPGRLHNTAQQSLTHPLTLHSQGGAPSRWSARPRPTLKTVSTCTRARFCRIGTVVRSFFNASPVASADAWLVCWVPLRSEAQGAGEGASGGRVQLQPAARHQGRQAGDRESSLASSSCYSPCIGFDVCCIGCLCLDCLANWDSAQSVELHMLQRFPSHDPNTLVYAHATFCLAELVNCFTCFVLCLVNGFVLHLVRLLMQW